MSNMTKKIIRVLSYGLLLSASTIIFNQTPSFVAVASPQLPSPEVKKVVKKSATVAVPNSPAKFRSHAEFVKTLYPYAKKIGTKYNVDPKILLAHAAHETNWGRSIPRHKNGSSSYNLFGIKANSKSAKKIQLKTTEHRKGVKKTEYAYFRSYDDFAESFDHYMQLMKKDRFKAVFEIGKNASAYFSHLQKAGYATDPHYAKKLIGVYNHPLIKQLA